MPGKFILGAFALLTAATAIAAEPLPPQFALPIDCEIGKNCYIQKYFDHDPAAGYRDYRCGILSGNKHDGTDIRLVDVAAMEQGVAVTAAAAGIVVNTREGMPDVNVALVGKNAVTDRGLGNRVVIRHSDGWLTIYGHLRRNSIAVRKGDTVQAGQVLAQVGMSGLSEFPHVHFAVRHHNVPVDPFTGPEKPTGCDAAGSDAAGSEALWEPDVLKQLAYRPSFVMHSGFATRPMARVALQYGLYHQNRLPRRHGRLYFGVFVAGLFDGDEYTFALHGPDGKLLEEKTGRISRRRGVQFFTVLHGRGTPLPQGRYDARFSLSGIRAGTAGTILEETRSVTLN